METTIHAGKNRFRFDYLGDVDYTRKDGQLTRLSLWQGMCTKCGNPFEVTAALHCDDPKKSSHFNLRTCKAHRNKKMSERGRLGAAALFGRADDKIAP
jgi:hypothetical protein